MKIIKRTQVLFVGSRRVAARSFTQRGLTLTEIQIHQLSDTQLLNTACAVLLSPCAGRLRLINEYFAQYFAHASQAGLLTGILAAGQDRVQVYAIRDAIYERLGLGVPGSTSSTAPGAIGTDPWVVIRETPWALAESFARHCPGPPFGSPGINGSADGHGFDADTEALLKRAFADCSRLRVERLTGGKSAKETLRVFATLAGLENGPNPMPFFVKHGRPGDIEKEKRNYRERAEPFIPFQLRPGLTEGRCVSTLTSAALVCNFVDSAIPLRRALRGGYASGAIFSLFETTLKALRAHSMRSEKVAGVIETFIRERVDAKAIRNMGPHRIEFARLHGLREDPVVIEERLISIAKAISSHRGIYHGDLHAGNIMVRNRDAIVIDFGSMSEFGPLSADPAFLEVSLAFGTDESDDPKGFEDWRKFIDAAFEAPLALPIQEGPHHGFEWLESALREVRHVAACCGVGSMEALVVLCACLLRFGRLSESEFDSPLLPGLSELRRSYALVVAERICAQLVREYGKS